METNIDKNESKVWSDPITKTYIKIMVDEVTKGNMQNGVFHSKIWNSMKDKLNSMTNRSFSVKQIKQKFNRLRTKYREFSLLLQHTGFGWDTETNIVTASEEVWQAYIRAHPEAAQFQKKGCEQYKLLGIIFNRSTATGVLHHSSSQDPPNTDEENELENPYLNTGVHVDIDQYQDSSDDVVQTFERKTRSGKSGIRVKKPKSKKEPRSYEMGDALQAWGEASKAKAEFCLARAEMYRANSNEATSSSALPDYSIAKCVTALEEMEGISDDLYAKALKHFRDADTREMFLTMCGERKKGFLNRLEQFKRRKVFSTMDIENTSLEGDACTFDDSSSDSSDDELAELFIINMIYNHNQKFLNKNKVRTSALTGREFIAEVLNGVGTTCSELFRMEKTCFTNFCNELREKSYLSDSRDVLLEEKVAMFLFIIGHNVRHRVVSDRFQHSTETVSRYFKEVLRAVCRLGKELIKQESVELPNRIKNNPIYYPWFKNCLGAIDGTHISAWVPAEKQTSCRGRKAIVTQNVMCVCDFNMMFTYVYSGWEGSAHDAEVFLDAVTNPNAEFPWPSRGSFYLVDSGYPCMGGFLPPYRGQRYYAQEYRGRGRQPTSREELFNYRHSSLRMTIERCFGVLKNRFPILKLMPPYKPSRQRLIVIACCAIHNYIRKWNLHDDLFRMWEDMDSTEIDAMSETSSIEGSSSNDDNLSRLSDQGVAEMAAYRDHIANWMWAQRYHGLE